jgi:hypothetical protein
VPKPPKPSYVSFGGIDVGCFWDFCTHAAGYNLFNIGRHLLPVNHYRNFGKGAFAEWGRAVLYLGVLANIISGFELRFHLLGCSI